MPRDYAKLLHSLWTNDDFRARSPHAQRLYMLILSQPTMSHAGVVPLTIRRWATLAAGTTVDDLQHDLAELEEARFVVADADTEEVLIRSYLRNDGVLGNPNLVVASVRAYQQITSAKIRAAWLNELHRLNRERHNQPEPAKGWTDPKAAPLLTEALADPLHTTPQTPSATPREDRPEPPSVPPSEGGSEGGTEGGTEPPPEGGLLRVRARHARTTRAAPAPTTATTTHSVEGRDAPATNDPTEEGPHTAQTLTGEWIQRCPKRPPNNVIGQVARHLKAMLEEGIDPGDIRAGLAAWHTKGLHPSTLPSVVNELMNARPALPAAVGGTVTPIRPASQATGDARAEANLALVAELRALEQEGP